MKHFITILFSVVTVSFMIAQSPKKMQEQVTLKRNLVNTLLQHQTVHGNITTAKTSSAVERVIAQSTRSLTSGSRQDSVKLNYILFGTSQYDYNQLLYAYNYPYSTSPMFNYLGNYTTPQILYKSYNHWTINPNTLVYGFYERNVTTYNAIKNLVADTTLYADSAIRTNMRYTNKFNSMNSIDTAFSYNLKSGISKNAFQQFFGYDASNKLIKDSIYEYHMGTWRIASKTFYTYDASNNLVQIRNFANNSDTSFTLPLTEQLKYVNKYDALNRLFTVETSFYDGTLLKPYVIDTFGYTASSTFHTLWKEYQYDAINMVWAPMIKMDKHLNTFGNPDTVKTYDYNTFTNVWTPTVKYILSYNSFNDPIKLFNYQYNFTSFPTSPSFTTTYYYEINTDGINENEKHKLQLSVFPNPSYQWLTIKDIGSKDAEGIVSIYDIQGKILNKQHINIQNGATQIWVNDIPQGNYILVMQNKSGVLIGKQSFIKCD